MAEQQTFAGLAWSTKGKVTRREQFLAEMNGAVPWARLLALLAPHYPKAGNGRQPLGLEKMFRIYCLQQWFNLSDPGAEDALYDSDAMRRFARIELGEDVIPDETTILRFRRMLEQHRLTEVIFTEICTHLAERGLLLHEGTIVDATIIAAPSSTKNAEKARDPDMHQTQKGNQWYFGMKVHFGTDRRGVVHSLTTTDAAAADITQLPALVHGAEDALFGDQAYWSEPDRQAAEAAGLRYFVNRRPTAKHPLSKLWKRINRARSRVRALCEHPLLVVKHLWEFRKVRYRGLAKNTVRVYALFGLANLYRMRYELLPRRAPCLL